MSDLKPPIFLLGNVRSGTSMLLRFFNLHPEVVSWYEPRTIWCYGAPGRQHDRFTAEDATPRVKRYIRNRFLRYQRMHENRRVMEKTPSNIMRIPYVHAIFPESRYVYIVREPLANLSSSELKWRNPIHKQHLTRRLRETPKLQLQHYAWRLAMDYFRKRILRRKHVSVWGVRYPDIQADLRRLSTEQVIARQWVQCSRQAEADLASLDPDLVLRIRYEDFVMNPVPQFERILNHFGLSMTEDIAQALDEQVDVDRQLKWKRLDPTVVAECLPILTQEMRRLGYEPPAEPDPTPAVARGETPDQGTRDPLH